MRETADIDLSSRLQRLEDLAAIQRLFIDYGLHLDNRDWPRLASLFAEEGEVLLEPLGRAIGPAAIEKLFEQGLTDQRGRTFHLIANPVVALQGDRATTNVSWAMISRLADDRPALSMFGRHRDELVREGTWKFLRREGVLEIPAALPAAFAPRTQG